MLKARHWSHVSAILLPLACTPAHAQVTNPPRDDETALEATPPPNASAAQDPAAADDGEIVVTAQRRSESLQKVPIAITVASGAELANTGVTSLTTLNTIAPGLNSRVTAGAFQPSIRGIGTSSNVVENPVALYIDGVYLPQQREGTRELPDVEQVAVLKGPQGTLFGRNATGGVIQITTRRPTQDFQFEAQAGYDTYETLRLGAFVSGGLTDNLASSFSVDYTDQGEGLGTNRITGNGTHQILHALSLRGKLLFELGTDTDVTLIGDYMDRKDRSHSFVPYPGTAFIVPVAGPIRSRYDTYSQIDSEVAFRGGGASLTVDHDFSFARLQSITSYREGKSIYIFDDVPVGRPVFYVQVDDGPNESFSQEIQLISPNSDTFTYTLGAFYFYNRNANLPIERNFFPPFFGPAGAPPTASARTQTFGSEKTTSFAPFGQIGIGIFEDTKLTLGARYTYEKRELDANAVAARFNGTVVNTPFTPDSLTIKRPTWRIALDHQFSSAVLGYVSYNRGIKSGGFNILNPANPAYLPERLDAYEAGLKTQLFDRRITLNAAAFYYDYANLQVTQFVGFAQSIVNGAAARLYGLDVDFNARITPELRLSGGFAALDTKFTDYRNAVGSIPRPTGGATLINVDATGNRVPLAQEFSGTLAIDYDRKFSFGGLHYNLTGNYNGDYTFEADNFLRQDDYLTLNTSLRWTSPDDAYSVTVFGRNLLDERVLTQVTSQSIGYPAAYAQPPRTFGLLGKVSF